MWEPVEDGDGNIFCWRTIEEEWRWVPGYEEIYIISNYGRVYGIPRYITYSYRDPDKISYRWIKGGLKQLFVNNRGYLAVSLKRDGNPSKVTDVHVLVAGAFIGPRPPGMDTRHKDGDGLNPCVWNLEYGSRKDNCDDMVKHGTRLLGEAVGSSKYTERQIIEVKKLLETNSIAQTSIKTGVNISTISQVKRGTNWILQTPGIPFGPNNYNTGECQFINLDNSGRIIGVIRDNSGGVNAPNGDLKAGTLLMQRSSDWGQTWLTGPLLTGIGAASASSNNVKVCPRIIKAPGNPGRVIVESNDRGGGNRMILATATIDDAFNNIWSATFIPMTTATQGNGDICVIDDVAKTYIALEHRTIGSGTPYYTTDDYYVVRRDVYDWS